MIEDIEEKSYNKLIKQFKARGIQYFETPLVVSDTSNSEQQHFLSFMQVTMGLLRLRNKDTYTYMINQLLNCRANYIELSYSQMIQ